MIESDLKNKLKDLVNGNKKYLDIKVKTKSSKQEIIFDEISKKIYVFVKSAPENNKANEEIIKLFKKHGLIIEIKKGLKSKNKTIEILN